MRAGSKQGHWIWYVFPQLSGLGVSQLSETYGIAGVAEASDYVRDAVLCSRMVTISTTVAERLREGVPLTRLMSSRIDARKLVSSLTLFELVAKRLYEGEGNETHRNLGDIAEAVLGMAESQGHPPCRYTLDRLKREGRLST